MLLYINKLDNKTTQSWNNASPRPLFPAGDCERRGTARRVLGQQEAHWLRGAEEPGRYLLHELPPASLVLQQPTQDREL